MTQFEQLLAILKEIHSEVKEIHRDVLEIVGATDDDLDFLDEDETTISHGLSLPDTPRTTETYKTVDGTEATINVNELEDRVREVLQLAKDMGEIYQLWERPDGGISVMVSSTVVDRYSAIKSREVQTEG